MSSNSNPDNINNSDSDSQFPYVGWVPTVSTRLSFRHIGEARTPTESRYANVTTEDERFILAYQRRPLSDLLFETILSYLCNVVGDFWFVFAGTSADPPGSSEEIGGKVYIFKSKDDWRTLADARIRETINEINDLVLSVSQNRDGEIRSKFGDAESVLKAVADISLDLVLKRNGTVFFGSPQFRDSELKYASSDYAKHWGHDFEKWVADQSYFFLRDICHRHQHHGASSDTILILQNNSDDVEWRKHIIFSLYYYIIRSKRFADASSLYQSAGVLAYTSAFKRICREALGEKGYSQIPNFDDQALLQSMEAKASEEVSRANESALVSNVKVTRAANLRMFSLVLVAISATFLFALIQPAIDKGKYPNLVAAGNVIGDNFLAILGLLLLLLVGTWAFTHRDWHVETSLGRNILEASNVVRKAAIASYAVAGILVLIGTFYLGSSALSQMWSAVVQLFGVFASSF